MQWIYIFQKRVCENLLFSSAKLENTRLIIYFNAMHANILSKLFTDWSRKPEQCYEQYDWHITNFHNLLKWRTSDTKCFNSREEECADMFEYPAIWAYGYESSVTVSIGSHTFTPFGHHRSYLRGRATVLVSVISILTVHGVKRSVQNRAQKLGKTIFSAPNTQKTCRPIRNSTEELKICRHAQRRRG
jgi:hypothetical protein